MRLHKSLRRTINGALLWKLVAGLSLVMTVPAVVSAQQVRVTPQADLGRNAGGIIDRVLVRIDGRAILYSEYEGQWRDQLTAIASQFSQVQIDVQTPVLRMQMMVGMAQGIMLELHAEDLGIVADVNEVDRAIVNMRESNGLTDEAAWAQALAQSGITEAMLREQAASSIVQQRMMMQEISRKVFVSPREVEGYYEQNLDTFRCSSSRSFFCTRAPTAHRSASEPTTRLLSCELAYR